MCPTALVTGATGNVGRHVLATLLLHGVSLRAGVSDLTRGRFGSGVEAVELDFLRPETFAPAVRGVAGIFLLRPPAISRVGPTLNRLVDVAAAAGVRHIAFLSVIGAGRNPLVPHHRVERHLRRTPIAWTFLRPSFFAQNLGDACRRDIRDDGRIFLPAGDGRAAFVDARDVAEVAAQVLIDPSAHAGRAYDLTGQEPVSFFEVAELLSGAVGRRIRYQPATLPAYAKHLRSQGLPLTQLTVQTVLHAGLRLGQAERVDPALPQLLGRRARTIRDYVEDHIDLWR